MKIHHLRNATLVIESKDKFILVDPMLGGKGSLPPFSFIRFKARKNPIVDLPENSSEILSKVTHILLTHTHTFGLKALQHTDHLDEAGEKFIKKRNLPIFIGEHDRRYLENLDFNILGSVDHWKTQEFLGGTITAIPALHGHGWNNKMMANGSGYIISLPDEPSIYISGDTVLTEDVKRALLEYKPEVTVVASGTAQVDLGPPILMTPSEVEEFIKLSPGRVICNHLEALNHCPTSRDDIKKLVDNLGVSQRVYIPNDGEVVDLR